MNDSIGATIALLSGRADNSLAVAHFRVAIGSEAEWPVWVTNGCADNMSGASEVPQPADPFWATRKSAEVGR